MTFTVENLEFFLAIAMRISGFVFIAPFFSNSGMPQRAKLLLSFSVALVSFFVVPQDEPLTTEACLASFEMAKQFFVKDHPTRLICHSWLLCPRLAELLPAESNIIRFMQLWTQEPCKPDNSVQAMERIFGFGFTADRLADAPEDSSLQRKAKRYLLDGGRLDACAGYIVL